MHLPKFFRLPTLGGWLTIVNSIVIYAICYAGQNQLLDSYKSIAISIAIVMSMPFSWYLLLQPIGGCTGTNDVVLLSVAVGLNSFVWGYGVAFLVRRPKANVNTLHFAELPLNNED